MARKDDAIDTLCRRWAATRRELIGKTELKWSRQYLGATHCTLSGVKDYQDGASSTGQIKQFYPEVYIDEEFEINRAFNHMAISLREIMDWHYVVRAPIKVKVSRMGISWSEYWNRVGRAKQYVSGWLEMSKQKDEDMAVTSAYRKVNLESNVEK